MTTKSVPARRSPVRRRRPIYHEVQPGGTSRGNVTPERTVGGEAQDFGGLAWIGIAIVALLLADTVAWDGYYAHRLWLALDDRGAATRHWADTLWG